MYKVKCHFEFQKEKSRGIGKIVVSPMRKHVSRQLLMPQEKKCVCVYIYTCIYIYNMRFIISLHNLSFSPKSAEQNSFLIAMEAGGRGGSSRAGRGY